MKAVLFDLDGTLYAYDPCHRAGLDAAYEVLSARLDLARPAFEALYERARGERFRHLGEVAAAHSRELYFKFLVEELADLPDVRLSLAAHDAYWEGYLAEMEPLPGCRELLEALAPRARLGLVTNLTTNVQLRKLVRLGLEATFEVIVTSEEAGADKPHPACFRLARERLGLPAHELVMIGDDLERDVLGADRVGIPSVWLRLGRPRRPLPERARSVEDLRSFMKAPWGEVFPVELPAEGTA